MAAARSRTAHPSTKLTIALVGGGSGGHITPLLAVAEELRKLQPDAELIYIGQTGDKLIDVPQQHHAVNQTFSIRAGKFRRYHGEGIKQILDISTFAKNIRDFFYFLIGMWQGFWLLGRIKPDVIFVKGGFVGVPIGLAAAARRIPYVTHDSDAIPGLANRIIARWATAHAVALPKSIYDYPKDITHTVGVPVGPEFRKVSRDLKANYKHKLGLKSDQDVIFITGGGLGAKRLNEAVVTSVVPLLKINSKLFIIHATGRDHEAEIKASYRNQLDKDVFKQVLVKGYFVNDLYQHSGAADVIVTRAGATSMAEFEIQQKCCIIVPNPQLTGGHQLKNAKYLADQKAAIVLEDEVVTNDPSILASTLTELLSDAKLRSNLAKNLGQFAKPGAAKELAQLLLEAAT